SMAQRLAAINADFALHYCTRSAERTAFRQEISSSAFADKVFFHFDAGPAAQKLDLPAALAKAAPEHQLYVCGPTGFIDHVVGVARAAGWRSEQIHLEYFGAAPQDTAGDT